MSDLPSESLGYQAVIAEFFLGLRGAGLLVSPLDQELVAEWERRGLPPAVVCRGIRHGVEAAAERRAAPPRSIRAVRLAVEDEWRAYRSGRVGDAPAPAGEAAVAQVRLAAARELLARVGREAPGPLRDAYRAAWRALGAEGAFPGTPLERIELALAAADARLLSGWLAALPRAERAALGARVALLAGSRPPAVSRRAHREGLRAHLLDLAGRAGLICLRGSV
jgi:hypothetical protein